MKKIKVNQTVDNAAEVGKTVVLEACRQVRESTGEREALEVAAGALSASVATIIMMLGEETARTVLDTALATGIEAVRLDAINAAGMH